MDSNVHIGNIRWNIRSSPSSKSCERSSSSNLALGTLCNILPTPEFSPDYRQRRPPVGRRHRLIRLGSTLSASRTGAEIRRRVPATRASSISSEFPFSKRTAYSRSYRTMARHCTRKGHRCCPPPLSFRGCALMPGRSEKPARDGQGGFRGGMKGRRIKGTRYGERARGTWVGNPGLL